MRKKRTAGELVDSAKSLVGRLVKRASDDVVDGLPYGQEDSTLRLVLEAWQFVDLDTATSDHPRGAHEPTASGGSTNFGGTRQ